MALAANGPVHSWGPDRRVRLACIAGTAAGGLWTALDSDPRNRLVAVVVAVGSAVVAVLLARIHHRLSADSQGMTISTPLRTRTVPWSQVYSIQTLLRGRFGRTSATLEIELWPGEGGPLEAGAPPDTELLVFGRFELGEDPAAVSRILRRLQQSFA